MPPSPHHHRSFVSRSRLLFGLSMGTYIWGSSISAKRPKPGGQVHINPLNFVYSNNLHCRLSSFVKVNIFGTQLSPPADFSRTLANVRAKLWNRKLWNGHKANDATTLRELHIWSHHQKVESTHTSSSYLGVGRSGERKWGEMLQIKDVWCSVKWYKWSWANTMSNNYH